MKNILLTSTALVAFAGAAVAEVDLSGRAEMGVFDTSSIEGPQFFTDIDVTFTMSGETDGGLTFGASVDLDEGGSGAAAVADNADDGGATIFISGAFGTVTMGDTDGAMDWALTEAGNVGNPGSIADDETAHGGYLGSYLDGTFDGQILRYDNTFGDFGFAISVEMDDTDVESDGFALGLKYNIDLGGTDVALGLGYQEAGSFDAIGISATANLAAGFSAGFQYADGDLDGVDVDHFGIGLGYTSGAISVHANYGSFGGAADQDGFGLAAAYDLGGGAVIHAGYGVTFDQVDAAGTVYDAQTASLGLGLSF